MTAKDQIVETKNMLTEKAKELASSAEQVATDVAHTAGEKIQTLSTTAADRFQRVGNYLQQNDIRAIGREVEHVVRENPIPSLIVGLGAGYLIGRLLAR